MSRLLHHRWLSVAVRVGLGVIFIYAALPKIGDPPAFAHLVWNYRLFPSGVINILALVLPWLELLVGAALVAGVFRRGAALWICAMLVAFIAALSTDIVRDIPVNCGCFSVAAVEKTHAELIAEMKREILLDVGMLMMALQVLFTRVTWKTPA